MTRRTRFLSTVLFISAMALTSYAADGFIPTGTNEFDFLYDRIERTEALNRDRTDFQLGPYAFDRLNSIPGFLGNIEKVTGEQVTLFGSVAEQASFRKAYRSTGYEIYRGGLAARPAQHLFLYGNFALDQQKAGDPLYRGKKWRGLAGDVEEAYASYQTKNLDLIAGRFGSFWGMRNSLALGPQAHMDGFGYSFRFGKVTLSYRLASLDPLTPDKDSVSQIENRYWAGHRIDLHLSNNLRIGLFETVVWGGAGRSVELAYLNPLLLFHAFQLNRMVNDNTFLGLDFSYKPIVGLNLYGQLLIDDFQIEKKTQGDQEPNEYGVLVGGYWAEMAPGWDIKAEYSRVTNRTFNQKEPSNRYLYENHLIGAALGNDYDRFSLSGYRWLGEQMRGWINLIYYRQGQGSPGDPWSDPWSQVTGHYSEPFPTGVVQKQLTAGIGIKGYLNQYVYMSGEVGLDRFSNFGHQAGISRTEPWARLTISLFGSTTANLK